MKVPPSFEYVYLREAETANKLVEYAGSRLRGLCADRKWLFDGRIKAQESIFCKLQMGKLASILDMNDIYAATVVVPTRAEIAEAKAAVLAEYPDSVVKFRGREDPQKFQYDDTHIYATLGRTAPGIDGAIRYRPFEIQIRTGLQFSWWKATHKDLYKADMNDWRIERVASQARGTLDMIDGVLADLPAAAQLLERRDGDADADFSQIVGWLPRWPEDEQPEDKKRFVDTVKAWLGEGGLALDQVEPGLDSDRGRELIKNGGITPAQVVQVLAAEEVGVEALAGGGRRVLVTEELVKVAPEFGSLEDGKRVQL